jgi:CRP/FNR family transcriptional regulator, cyclic AMP receptor protein
MHWIDALGYFGALLTIGTYSMKTMIPLRIIGICANVVFLAWGLSGSIYPSIFLHLVLLPLNATRLYQMLQLTQKVRLASQGDLNMDWLKPFMSRRSVKKGEVLFTKGELATAMFYTVTGGYKLVEIDTPVLPGQVVGEIGLIAPDNKRTLTFECTEDGDLLTISYSQVKQLYFQNPQFGFFFLQLISQRLFQDIRRLEEKAGKAA